MTGLTDKPAVVDDFQIQSYIDGLSDFIASCTAPMTISIQGDWGTGKTSIMQMVKNQLPSNVHKVWFNTWQFSQFNMGDQLPILFMSKLVCEMEDTKDTAKSKVKDVLGNIMKVSAGMLAGHLSNGLVTKEDLDGFLTTDFLNEIEKMKSEFQALINAKAKGDNDKVVIFVDDLDRLAPGRAVELLEVLKIFLDCEKCVFILAIDYSVVSRGVREKYGDDFGEEKGKSFFDKIIQVPFKMPVASYDISNYVKTCFQNIGLSISDEEIVCYKHLINHSIGNNPRGMKRLFNSYLLLHKIASNDLLKDKQSQSLLFAILCMQSSYETVYNYIVENREEIEKTFFEKLSEGKSELFKTLEMDEKQTGQFVVFIRDVLKLIDTDQQNNIDDEEWLAFKKILNFSTITSANVATEEENESYEKHYRYKHKDVCRNIILPEVNRRFNPIHFYDYSRKKYDIGSWWVYTRNEKGFLYNGRPLRFGYEICLCPPKSATDKHSSVTLGIYKIDHGGEKTTMDDVKKLLGENPFPNLNVVPESYDYGIYYRGLMPFDVNHANDETYEKITQLFCEQFEMIKQYFN
ncbi:MAG: hypothetical protein IKV74_06855 [Clostridia bacterium]|nr:hypothetical protein [Clostridia bacterium]